MALRTICILPDPALKEIAKPVEQVTEETRALVRDLFDTMYHEKGVGLAATQLAVPQRVLVIDLDPKGEATKDQAYADELADWGFTGPVALINPKFLEADGKIDFEEGCLSVPGVTETVQRKGHVVVEAQNEKGELFKVDAYGLFAVALQHENDHLDGKVFVDYLSKLKRDVIRHKMERLKQDRDGEASESVA